MSGIASAFEAWMAPMVVQAGLFVVVVALLDRLLHPWAWPQLRHALWLLVPLKLVLPPALASPVAVAPVATAAASAPEPGAPWLVLAWLAGVLLTATALAVRTNRARKRLLAVARPAPAHVVALARRCAGRLGLRRLPRVVVSRAAACPAVFGLRRPVVVLPAALDVPAEHVLLHELAHVRRGDLWTQAGFGVVLALYWFHPLVWLARARAHAVREICCDATVAPALGDATAYRATLLQAARRMVAGRPAGLAGFLFGQATLLARLRWLERARPVSVARRRVVTTVVVAAMVAAVLPMCRPRPAAPTPGTPRLAVEEARRDFVEALEGGRKTGCIRRRYAAMRLAVLEEKSRTP